MDRLAEKLRDVLDNTINCLSEVQEEIIEAALNRLSAYEDTGLDPVDILTGTELANVYAAMQLLKRYQTLGTVEELAALVNSKADGRMVELPFVAMVEKSLQDGKMTPQRDQQFNGRYAVVYYDPKKWPSPLIDICGEPYNREQAEARISAFTRTEYVAI